MVWTLPVQQRPPKPKPGEVRPQPVRESPEWQRHVSADEWPLVLDAEREQRQRRDALETAQRRRRGIMWEVAAVGWWAVVIVVAVMLGVRR